MFSNEFKFSLSAVSIILIFYHTKLCDQVVGTPSLYPENQHPNLDQQICHSELS
jgi:hypothetical protein